jgi:D-beta-D-heptose 7-phosphate kinase/D-beta-D-heptose 1-phosphate adenosyltransferase
MTRPLVVIGDVMLDVDRSGLVDRLSPEAPVPVLHRVTETRRPGGAALAALLAARSNSRPVFLIAPFADDAAAAEVRRLIGDGVQVVALPWGGTTPVKTRLRAGNHPIARVDEGGGSGVIGPLPAVVETVVRQAAAVLVADYGGGVTGYEPLRHLLSSISVRTPIVWDPHPRGSDPITGTWCVTPNEAELRVLSPSDAGSSSRFGSLRARAAALRERWRTRAVCVTLGAEGAMLCTGGNPPLMVAAPAVAVTDTCGAGDSFAAAAALAFADGLLPSEAVRAAIDAAAQFVADGGAAGFEIGSAQAQRDVPRSTAEMLQEVRRSGGSVVATGGCFDLLHAGHIATLQAARALGDCLVVCLNSDSSVRRLKGNGRPLQPEQDRAKVLAALACVDAVVVFDEETPCAVLRELRPDVWAKGGDYSGMTLPEAEVLAEWGGEIVTVPYLPGRSTSALVELAGTPAS